MSRADPGLPAWFRRPGESWLDWEQRRLADIKTEFEAREQELRDWPMPTRMGGPATAVGTYDCNGLPKGSGWHGSR